MEQRTGNREPRLLGRKHELAVLNELKTSPLFDEAGTQFSCNVSGEDPPGTFTFCVLVKLKNRTPAKRRATALPS